VFYEYHTDPHLNSKERNEKLQNLKYKLQTFVGTWNDIYRFGLWASLCCVKGKQTSLYEIRHHNRFFECLPICKKKSRIITEHEINTFVKSIANKKEN